MNDADRPLPKGSADLMVPSRLPESGDYPGSWLQLGLTPALEWNCYELKIAQLPRALEGRRIIHLTDLHLTPRWSQGYDRFLQKIQSNPPDLILITGDFVDDKIDHRKALPTVERFVKQLVSRHGIFGVMGNHDGDLMEPRLGAMGVQIIQHTYVHVELAGQTVELIGLRGVKRRDFDPDFIQSVPPRSPGVPRIILGHYPDQVRFVAPLNADAMLVGHTHGGQICLPNGFPPLTHDKLPRRMAQGVHRFGQTLLFVSRGFGTTKWPIRIFAPAEVIELRLGG